jgi:Helix-turn-helix domain
MSGDAARPPRKVPAPGERFKPREVFGGIGAFVPEKVAASTMMSMTAKLCYGHLVRRAGQNDRCWPSIRDIAKHIGVEPRQTMRALRELAEAKLIRTISRKNATGRQTSNEYEFIWGPILQGEGDTSDTLTLATSDGGRVSDVTPTGLTAKTPLEVSKRNHHQGSTQERSSEQGTDSLPSQNSERDDDDSEPTKYASARDELKALATKAGASLRVADIDSIEALLACGGVTWDAFVEEARQHSWSRITNPVGFLKSLARKFRARTRLASAPVTADEWEARNYRCQVCDSRTPGEGALLVNGALVPCSCANCEWIARQRARGVFAAEKPHASDT